MEVPLLEFDALVVSDAASGIGAGTRLLDGVSMQLCRGERVGILGRSGGAPAALLDVLAGHRIPDGGEVFVQGGPLGPAPVAVVTWSGTEPGATGRADRWLATLERAVARRPALLVLDDPVGGLDITGRHRLLELVASHRSGLLVCSADPSALVDLVGRVVLVADGRIVVDAPTIDVITDVELLAAHGLALPPATSPAALRRIGRRWHDRGARVRPHATGGLDADVSGPTDRLAAELARHVEHAVVGYRAEFQGITRRAARRFAQRDWASHQFDARERLVLHERCVTAVVAALRPVLERLDEQSRRDVWVDVRHRYAGAIAWWPDSELAETFFNSVTRRLFEVIGIDDRLEFRWFGGIVLPAIDPGQGEVATFRRRGATHELFDAVLSSVDLLGPWVARARDAARLAEAVERHTAASWEEGMPVDIDLLRPVFYRNKGAYLVGRLRHLNRVSPLVVPLRSTSAGVEVDAVLLTENLTSRIFGFTRSYFHVDTTDPAAVVAFVKSIVPNKPVAELYTTLGFHQHGKTALYRALYRHLEHSTDRFEIARGTPGMVMTVFTLPSFDVVFKVIKDTFAPSKRTTRSQVRAKYRLVFGHDRVGRMVDAQEFENLTFDRRRFDERLLDELAENATRAVDVTADTVVLRHCYTEREVHPLDLYFREMPPEQVRDAALDYGQAVKDLAAADIFPGDLFPKNFGVTRHGSVVFYDYDEVDLVSRCRFRELPEPDRPEDELADEPWFTVGDHDVFPEEFRRYLWVPPAHREEFVAAHGDLADVAFWRRLQAQHAAGQWPDFEPYPQALRFPPA